MTAGAIHAQSSVSVRDVSKVFFAGPEPVWALEEISLEIEPGSFTCIVGPSGCGKSTLLRIIGGLEQATTGEVEIHGADDEIPAAFVFQEHGVFPWQTVLDNVAFGLRQKKVARAERTQIAREWLSRVGLSGFEKSYPHELSGGMRQRIAIARAFATGSSLLLMDEPLGALDAQTRLLMQEELVGLWEAERKTVVMVTHGIEEALLLGDRVIAMTARPGKTKEDIQVPFMRPRTMDLERTPEFAQARHHVWELLRDEVKVTEEGR